MASREALLCLPQWHLTVTWVWWVVPAIFVQDLYTFSHNLAQQVLEKALGKKNIIHAITESKTIVFDTTASQPTLTDRCVLGYSMAIAKTQQGLLTIVGAPRHEHQGLVLVVKASGSYKMIDPNPKQVRAIKVPRLPSTGHIFTLCVCIVSLWFRLAHILEQLFAPWKWTETTSQTSFSYLRPCTSTKTGRGECAFAACRVW